MRIQMWRAAPDQSYRLFRYTPQIPHSTYTPILGHSRSPILGRHPDQSYRLFRYTPQILRTLRSSAILDRRSSAATNARIFFRPEAPPRTPPHTRINIHLDH
ncbi:hypothetical protein, variant [Blastomyces dermatitidis ER-3]|uniref:Uncharacterized protein n=1 Tax=Ajellomyces dermatitidis (strain ER-3 / ATCC MYA-2586) TaxID=559297 RepID=A0ABX2VRY3_AJEDR|nr:uncharacterized protein BDCG_16287 [Blastomyces dermatitidis ER-3]XP_045279454.1 hypothetical protein, variant [Blastomyces dermatitidis ER-3]OAS99725.1 hypothetical protein BDCG_16287 [Blastomyces dermatitidis ER-3]OAS99726.1 hypothetical protein, variant [Blastomyces dermatitidis ER-3]